jgi:DNA mismatch endonuclease (patch repair protein)
VAVFVDGCFWHGCPIHSNPAKWLKKSSMPDASPSQKRQRSGRAFWTKKMARNIARDRFVNRQLRKAGWRVVRIWEHELTKSRDRCVQRIHRAIKNS